MAGGKPRSVQLELGGGGRGGGHSWKRPGCSEKICNVNTSTSAPSALKNLAQKMCKTKMRLKLAQHYAQPIFRGQRNAQGMGKTAFLYYDAWWDKDRNR